MKRKNRGYTAFVGETAVGERTRVCPLCADKFVLQFEKFAKAIKCGWQEKKDNKLLINRFASVQYCRSSLKFVDL